MDAIRQYKKLLCIEGNADTSKLICEILNNSFGKEVIEVIVADTGVEGLELYKTLDPEIILCNEIMPDKSGYEICQELRSTKTKASLILIIDRDNQEESTLKAWEADADGYLSQPIQKGELLFLVNNFLRIASLNSLVKSKDEQIQKKLKQLFESEKSLFNVNEEIKEDKRRLHENLNEMVTLNTLLDDKSNEIVEMNENLSNRFDSTVSLLVNIIELKQSSHRGHSERVADISVFIARKLGLSEPMIQNIEIAARLHEIGIVSLPADENLEEVTDEGKSRKVTRHPLVGEMLLKGFPGFEVVAEIIRHSHENVNGSGIPDGLTGDHIPSGSRIISVASYYDHSILSNPNFSELEILSKVEKAAGTLFDEDVVAQLGEYIQSQELADTNTATIDCTVFALKKGMALASDIYSESGINLLRKGAILDKEILEKLIKFHNVDPIAGTIKIKQS
ncbi:MAG: HD domain-containing phosphohydrolase [Nitrospinales bacterium]